MIRAVFVFLLAYCLVASAFFGAKLLASTRVSPLQRTPALASVSEVGGYAAYQRKLEEQKRAQALKLAEAKRKAEGDKYSAPSTSSYSSPSSSYSSKPAEVAPARSSSGGQSFGKSPYGASKSSSPASSSYGSSSSYGREPEKKTETYGSTPSYGGSAYGKADTEARAKAAYLQKIAEQKRTQAMKLAEAKRRYEKENLSYSVAPAAPKDSYSSYKSEPASYSKPASSGQSFGSSPYGKSSGRR